MANTFELIASSTVGSGGAASIDFTSIPSTYTDLCVKISSRIDNTGATFGLVALKLNGSSSSITTRILYGYGSGTGSLTDTYAWVYSSSNASTSNTFGNAEYYIPNYTLSNYKSSSADAVSENNATDARQNLAANLWSNTAAVTSITLQPFTNGFGAANFMQYSTAYLYGVKNA